MNPVTMAIQNLRDEVAQLRKTQIPAVSASGSSFSSGFSNGSGLGISNAVKSGWATNDAWEELSWDSSTVLGASAVGIGGSTGLIIKQPGVYQIVANVGLESTNIDADCYIALMKNGSPMSWRNIAYANGHNTAESAYFGGGNVSGFARLEKGDVISVALNLQNSGTAATLTTPALQSSLSITRLS